MFYSLTLGTIIYQDLRKFLTVRASACESRTYHMNKVKLLIFTIGGLCLILILILGLYLVGQRTSFFGRASSQENSHETVDLNASLIFASPVQVRANGKEKIRLSVYLLSASGLPVKNEVIRIQSQPKLSFSASSLPSDSEGKAVFDMLSSTPGTYQITVSTPNGLLKQTVTIEFK